MPATKCGGCAKFISQEAAKCGKCSALFHRACGFLPLSGFINPTWVCPSCKNASVPGGADTMPAAAYAPEESKDTSVLNCSTLGDTQDIASVITTTLRNFKEELQAEWHLIFKKELQAELQIFQSEFQSFRTDLAQLKAVCDDLKGLFEQHEKRMDVHEKRVGILKPQGSLERTREERALATQEDQEVELLEDKSEDKKEVRKPRVNIAMAAIMTKQKETNKQVKFVPPPPTPDSVTDATESKEEKEKPKVIPPNPIKSSANLPMGRKKGGILSFKNKSAGYPHLVLKTEPESPKKVVKEDKKEAKPSQSSQNSQTYQQKRQDHPPSLNWNPIQNNNPDAPRMNFQKNYGIQNAGLSFNPSYPPPNFNNQGIRLPVVNPKEIDVRTAALQKQNSRQELFQDGQKFNLNYQTSGHKKKFLNNLPPRFANRYRWQSSEGNQFNDNKFRDDSFKPNNTLFNAQQPRSWSTQPPQQPPVGYQQPMWWKPEQPNNFNENFQLPPPIQPYFYAPHTDLANPYQNISYNQLQYSPSDVYYNIPPPTHNTPHPHPHPHPPNFNSSLNSFSNAPAVSYDSSMYPQFNNKLSCQPFEMKMVDNPLNYQGSKDLMDMNALNFGGTTLDMQQRSMNMNFNEPISNDMGSMNMNFNEPISNDMGSMNMNFNERISNDMGSMDQIGSGEGGSSAAPGSTYSLFSGASDTSAGGSAAHRQPPSLWSGPGPSPLERLLEEQKQMKSPQ